VSGGLMTEQYQALIDDLGREESGQVLDIMRRADRVYVNRNDIETGKPAYQLNALARRKATPAWCRNSRRAGWVKDVHVEAQINRTVLQLLMQFGEDVCEAARKKFSDRDDVIAKRFGLFEDALDVGRAADADMIRQRGDDTLFLSGVGELG